MTHQLRPESRPPGHLARLWPALVIALLTFLAYQNTFHVPFVFDDQPSILQNPTILRLRDAWSPPAQWGVTVAGRPILNVSLAINYAISGVNPWSYHVFNFLLHIAAACALYGFVRRTLLLPSIPASLRENATAVAAIAAALWAVHPLQTESVTYVIQRAESLMGLFFLLTFYAVVRSLESPRPKAWQAIAIVSCAIGAGTKEVIATAPILVLFYDRAFIAGSFRAAWSARRGLYLGLAFTWVILGLLVASTGGDRGGTFALTRHIATTYWASQTEALVDYFRLSFWPHPLVFERGLPHVPEGALFPVYSLAVASMIILTLIALWKSPRIGFLALWFLAILAPTSILPGTIQSVVEHRMYLSLAAVVVGATCFLTSRFGPRALIGLAMIAPVAAAMTYRRNTVYRDDFTLWSDTLVHSPRSAIAEGNIGLAFFNAGQLPQAVEHYKKALAIDPSPPNSHYNLALTDVILGRNEDALKEFANTVRLNPRHYPAHYEAGKLLRSLGRRKEAEEQFRLALAQKTDLPPVYEEMGLLATDEGDWAKAKSAFEEAWRLNPQLTAAVINLGVAEFRLGQLDAASRHLEYAIKAAPDTATTHFALGQVRLAEGNRDAAHREFEEALRLDPKSVEAQISLGLLFAQEGDVARALPHFETAVKLQPKNAEAHGNLANVLVETGKIDQALEEYRTSVSLDPSNPRVHANFGNALLKQQQLGDAQEQFAAAARLDPADAQSAELAEKLRAYLAERK